MVKQDGLEWVDGTFGLEPRWKKVPDIAKVEFYARKHLQLEQNDFCHVTFHAQGAFNKIYKVETEVGCSLMRITLPVDPSNKTNSEVATIKFICKNTEIPVPKIFAFDDSSENELGFEWILMEMLPGRTLRARWRKISFEAKRHLVKQVAKYQAQLFHHKLSAIGNIFINSRDQPSSAQQPHNITVNDSEQASQDSQQSRPVLDQLVSMIFFWGNHITQDVPRGPFTSSEDWIRARLTLVLTDQEIILKTSDDEDDIEAAQDSKEIVQQLLELLPTIFPPGKNLPEPSILFHDDLSMQNILVDEDGEITGIIDWECVSALPLWRACELPGFLLGRDRSEEPKRFQYSAKSENEEANDFGNKEALDDEGMNSLFWEHLQEYELTMLRAFFLKEMEELEPEWIEESKKGATKADFEVAVQGCDDSWRTRILNSWLEARKNGETWSLKERLLE